MTFVYKVLREFHMMMLAKQYIGQGGLDYAKTILGDAMDSEEADELINRVQRLIEGNPFEFMEDADPENLLELLRHEHPQTISLVLAHLSPRMSSSILQGLPSEVKLDVVRRITSMDQIAPEVITMLLQSLRGRISSLLNTSQDRVGGPEKVAEILNLVDTTSEKQIMSGLAADDPELVEKIQSLMFTFEDLEHIDGRGIQRIMQQTETNDVVYAIRGATDSLKDKFLSCVSTRKAAEINEELEVMQRVPIRDVEGAQQRIVEIAKELEEAGEIVILRGGEEEAQYI